MKLRNRKFIPDSEEYSQMPTTETPYQPKHLKTEKDENGNVYVCERIPDPNYVGKHLA